MCQGTASAQRCSGFRCVGYARTKPRDVLSQTQGRHAHGADPKKRNGTPLVDYRGYRTRQTGTVRHAAGGRVIRIVVSNQRGGVAKTTTAVNLARCFADRQLKTLLIDTDSQGSISTILGLKPQFTLHDFLIRQMVLKECVVQAHDRIDVLCSDRKTAQAEDIISGQTLREVHFE